MEYFVSSHHWFNAFEHPLETYMPILIDKLNLLLGKALANSLITETKKTRTLFMGNKVKLIAGGVCLILIMIGLLWLAWQSNWKTSTPVLSERKVITQTQNQQSQQLANPTSIGRTLAVMYFDNSGGDPKLEPLRKGLSDMLISELAKAQDISVVEREKLEKILHEQNLTKENIVDPSSAARIGKLLGVQTLILGSYFELYGQLRIDARVVSVETGRILHSEGVEGPSHEFMKLKNDLAVKILSSLNISGKFLKGQIEESPSSMKLFYCIRRLLICLMLVKK
jgi:TolB-like protein